ncbi:MAG: RtcB family protein [Deltaproteobacteria bacterium]|nr:RtcB family protein [Deltaproteobacteria bacterium]
MSTEKLRRIDSNRLEIPKSYKAGMHTNRVIYLDKTLEKNLDPKAIYQGANVAMLPGIVGSSIAMPDIHTGYGFTIGGVAAFDLKEGVISPGGVGYDINCGVRLLKTELTKKELSHNIKDLIEGLYATIPAGVGSKGKLRLNAKDYKKVLVRGSRWVVEQGYGNNEDIDHTESQGCLEGADPDLISKRAYERGREQLGTLGSGNHFTEIQYVDEIYDQTIASSLGLFKNQITIMIHTGSRGFGHQVCTDFLEVMKRSAIKHSINLPDRELACAPFDSPEARDYMSAMRAAANYAWANRQLIMHWVNESFMRILKAGPNMLGMSLVYDVAHNIAKVEEHIVNGKTKKLIVHRKGATRAFPPGHPDLPEIYRKTGQPVIIPGDMGRASFILVGTTKSMKESFGSTCHGAGRALSRNQAVKKAKGRAIWREMEDRGIIVRATGKRTLAEEMPEAYKDASNVVNVVHNAGLSEKVAKLRPLGVIKG